MAQLQQYEAKVDPHEASCCYNDETLQAFLAARDYKAVVKNHAVSTDRPIDHETRHLALDRLWLHLIPKE